MNVTLIKTQSINTHFVKISGKYTGNESELNFKLFCECRGSEFHVSLKNSNDSYLYEYDNERVFTAIAKRSSNGRFYVSIKESCSKRYLATFKEACHYAIELMTEKLKQFEVYKMEEQENIIYAKLLADKINE